MRYVTQEASKFPVGTGSSHSPVHCLLVPVLFPTVCMLQAKANKKNEIAH